MHTSYKNQHSPHLSLAKKYWIEHLSPSDLAVDATCGNGYDTLFLSQILPTGKVYAFDIQPTAIQATEKLLSDNQVEDRVILRNQSHAEWAEDTFSHSPSLIVYNLGYLPKGDKQVTTQTETTLQSIRMGMHLLREKGAMSITCYPGHEEGAREENAMTQLFASLPLQEWSICYHTFINRPKSPSLFWLIKWGRTQK